MKDRFIICYPLHLLACRFRLHCPSKNPGLLQSRTTRLAALFLALILAAGVHPLSAEINSRHTLLWATFPYPPGVSTDFQKNRDLFLAPVMDPQEVARAALRDENRITDFTAQQFNRLDGNICSDLLQLREAVAPLHAELAQMQGRQIKALAALKELWIETKQISRRLNHLDGKWM